MSTRHWCSLCLLFLFYQSSSASIPFFPIHFYWASVSAPHGVSPLSHSLFLCRYLPALLLDLLTLSPLFLICALHSSLPFILVVSFILPFPSSLFFPLFPSFLYGKSKVINYEIVPWFEDTHDLLNRLLSWNGCTKHDNEMMKFLHYLIFINQHNLTCFSFKILFYFKKEIFTTASWVSFLLVSSYPFSSFIFLWRVHFEDLEW